MQCADEAGQRGKDVFPGGFRRERVARDVAGDEGEDLPALVVGAERDRGGGEPGLVQVGEVGLDGAGEGSDGAADGVPDPDDAGGDAVSGQRLPVVVRAVPACAGHVISRAAVGAVGCIAG